jgi:Tol biopolymer transport system component
MPVDPASTDGVYVFGDFDTVDTFEIAHFAYPGGARTVLSLQGLNVAMYTRMAISPDGTLIAVTGVDNADHYQLHVYCADGSGSPAVIADAGTFANDGAVFRNLSFSPDGTTLAYQTDSAFFNSFQQYVASVAGGNSKAVSPAPPASGLNVDGAVWAPDSQHLVYHGDVATDELKGIWTVDVTDAVPVPVEIVPAGMLSVGHGPTYLGAMRFDAAGKVYFLSDHVTDFLFQLFRADIDGQNLEQVPGSGLLDANSAEVSVGNPRLSPDGTHVAFAAATDASHQLSQVYVLDVTTPSTASVVSNVLTTPTGSYRGVPTSQSAAIQWSPDGTKLAVIADWTSDDDLDVYVLPTSGAPGGVRLTGPDADVIKWSSAGAQLFIIGEMLDFSEGELFTTADFATPDQAASSLLIEDVVSGGSLLQYETGLVIQP